MTNLIRLLEKRAALSKMIDSAWRKEFPVGTRVVWRVGDYCRYGHVIDHGHSERLKVKNEKTGKELWLDIYRILEEP